MMHKYNDTPVIIQDNISFLLTLSIMINKLLGIDYKYDLGGVTKAFKEVQNQKVDTLSS